MRLTLMVPGATGGTRRSVFGDTTEPVAADPRRTRPGAVIVCAPEPACVRTAETVAGMTGGLAIADRLSGPDFGRWAGLTAEQVMERDPAGLRRWLRDPQARPHGGESLVDHLARVAELLDTFEWPDAGAVIVAPAFTVRAACVHALRAGPEPLLHLDLAPGTTATISRSTETWRLRSIVPAAG